MEREHWIAIIVCIIIIILIIVFGVMSSTSDDSDDPIPHPNDPDHPDDPNNSPPKITNITYSYTGSTTIYTITGKNFTSPYSYSINGKNYGDASSKLSDSTKIQVTFTSFSIVDVNTGDWQVITQSGSSNIYNLQM